MDFIDEIQRELARGFIARSARLSLIPALLPGISYSRTELLADTFDRIFFNGLGLAGLPDRPALCMNATLLNNGQVAKFARDGFSAWGICVPNATPRHVVPWDDFRTAAAVAASAAFPVGLPPMTLQMREFPPGTEFGGSLSGSGELHLADGGVLENLGIQTLIKSRRYCCWDLVVSDAGTYDRVWRGGAWGGVRSFAVWALSGRALDRLMIIMNDKQNRWARQEIYDQLVHSWLVQSVRDEGAGERAGLRTLVEAEPERKRRKLLFVRVAQDWGSFVRSVPEWRLAELGERAGLDRSRLPPGGDVAKVVEFLESAGCDLARAESHYDRLGGDEGARAVNRVATGFSSLPEDSIRRLADHAAWQVHASHAIYFDGTAS